MHARELSTKKAEDITSIAAADFSRTRKAKLDRFTTDRLVVVLGSLDKKVNVSVQVHPRIPENGLHPS